MASKVLSVFSYIWECVEPAIGPVLPWLHILGTTYCIAIVLGGVALLVFGFGCMNKKQDPRPTPSREDLAYIHQLRHVIKNTVNFSSGASRVLDYLYLGGFSNASDLPLLEKLQVTHVLNCAATWCQSGPDFYGKKYKYLQFEAEDDEDYDMMQHFQAAYDFIEDARESEGVVFVHCMAGVNRSGVLTVAYLMAKLNVGPITAAEKVLKVRGYILSNESFQEQLVAFARKRGLLQLDAGKLNKKKVSH